MFAHIHPVKWMSARCMTQHCHLDGGIKYRCPNMAPSVGHAISLYEFASHSIRDLTMCLHRRYLIISGARGRSSEDMRSVHEV